MTPPGSRALAALAGAALGASALALALASPSPPGRTAPSPGPPSALAAASSGVAVLRTPGPAEILIPRGAFRMGSDELEVAHALEICRREPAGDECREEFFAIEYPAHEVLLDAFWIDRAEVTLGRYERCVEAGACALPPYASGGERFRRPELPVVLVTWQDASRFCAFAGGRLPTEAEWERAARGASGRRYPFGQVYNPLLANHGRLAMDELDPIDGFLELAPAGSFPGGRTAEGLDDMAGNVEEWVADHFSPEYPRASQVNPRGPRQGELRVVRGGSYADGRPWMRAAARGRDVPAARRAFRGFRCARDAKDRR